MKNNKQDNGWFSQSQTNNQLIQYMNSHNHQNSQNNLLTQTQQIQQIQNYSLFLHIPVPLTSLSEINIWIESLQNFPTDQILLNLIQAFSNQEMMMYQQQLKSCVQILLSKKIEQADLGVKIWLVLRQALNINLEFVHLIININANFYQSNISIQEAKIFVAEENINDIKQYKRRTNGLYKSFLLQFTKPAYLEWLFINFFKYFSIKDILTQYNNKQWNMIIEIFKSIKSFLRQQLFTQWENKLRNLIRNIVKESGKIITNLSAFASLLFQKQQKNQILLHYQLFIAKEYFNCPILQKKIKAVAFICKWLHRNQLVTKWAWENGIYQTMINQSMHNQIINRIHPLIQSLYKYKILPNQYLNHLFIESLSPHNHTQCKIFQYILVVMNQADLQNYINKISQIPAKAINRQVASIMQAIVRNQCMKIKINQQNQLVTVFVNLLANYHFNGSSLVLPILQQLIKYNFSTKSFLLSSICIKLKLQPCLQVFTLIEMILALPRKNCYDKQNLDLLIRQGMIQYWLKFILITRKWEMIDWLFKIKAQGKIEKQLIIWLWQIFVGMRNNEIRKLILQFFYKAIGQNRKLRLLNEQSSNYFFFNILLRIDVSCFDMESYKVLEKYLIQKNLDVKILNKNYSGYVIEEGQLIGIDAIWQIMFNTKDYNVHNQCGGLLIKLLKSKSRQTSYPNKFLLHCQKILYKKLSDQVTITKNSINNQNIFLLQRILAFIVRVLDEVQELSATKGSINNLGQEITVIIDNREQAALPPKKFIMKIWSNMKLSQVSELIVKKLNPERKVNQVQIMTRGNYLINYNKTIKELKIGNRQTLMILSYKEELLKKDKSMLDIDHQKKLVELSSIFSDINQKLLRYIIQKKPHHEMQELASLIVDEQKLLEFQKQIQQKQKSKQQNQTKFFSNLIANNSNFFDLFVDIMHLQIQKLSGTTWSILSILPGNQKHLGKLKGYIKQDYQLIWKNLLGQQNSFQNLYSIQQLVNLLMGNSVQQDKQKEELKCMREKFLQNGGLNKQNLQNLKQTKSVSKLIYLIQIIKIYIKIYLQTNTSQTSFNAIKQIMKYKEKIQNLNSLNLQNFCQNDNSKLQYGSRKSCSFRFSSTSRSFSSALTPTFQSPATSRSNSPLEPNNRLEQLNQYKVELDKDNNEFEQNERKRKKEKFGSEVSFISVKCAKENIPQKKQQSQTFNQKHISEINKVIIFDIMVQKILTIFSTVEDNISLDMEILYQYCFDILLPLLLIDCNLEKCQCLLDNQYFINVTNNPNMKIRRSFIFFMLLLCRLDQTGIFIERLNKIFSHFINSLTSSSFYNQDCFIGFSKIMECSQYCSQTIWNLIRQRQQSRYSDKQDGILAGLLLILSNIYKINPSDPKHLPELLDYLFKLQSLDSPKIKKRSTRKRAFNLILDMNKDHADLQYVKEYLPQIDNIIIQQPIRTAEFVGLKNLGATCYINSLIQQLFMIVPFRNYFQNLNTIEPTSIELKLLFSRLCYSIKQYISPEHLIKTLQLDGKPIDVLIQQDVNEFYNVLISKLEQQNNKLDNLIVGVIENEIISLEGKYPFQKRTDQKFYSLCLDIKDKNNLQQALNHYVKGQLLDGENKYFCQEYNQKIKVIRKCRLKILPHTLVITLKRFEFDYQTMTKSKLNDYFQFPNEIDFAPWTRDTNEDQIADMFEQNPKLVGILVHTGNVDAGHYYSFIMNRNQGENRWFQFNDSIISSFNTEKIGQECFGNSEKSQLEEWNFKSKNAYLLFYEKDCDQKIRNNEQTREIINKQNLEYIHSQLIHDGDYYWFLQELGLKKQKKKKINLPIHY